MVQRGCAELAPARHRPCLSSSARQLKLDSVVDDANETHMSPWLAMLKESGIRNTPLSPFLHKQLLAHNHLHVDGSAIEAAGFKYAVRAAGAMRGWGES